MEWSKGGIQLIQQKVKSLIKYTADNLDSKFVCIKLFKEINCVLFQLVLCTYIRSYNKIKQKEKVEKDLEAKANDKTF